MCAIHSTLKLIIEYSKIVLIYIYGTGTVQYKINTRVGYRTVPVPYLPYIIY
jgi:hypothetical protein